MRFVIITPSLNRLEVLQRCVASVADQAVPFYAQVSGVGGQPSSPQASPSDRRTEDRGRKTKVGGQVGMEAFKCPAELVENVEVLNEKMTSTCDDFNESGTLTVHHHVQDGGSTDGTLDWLRQYEAEIRSQRSEFCGQELDATRHSPPATLAYSFSYSSGQDDGMYDAVRRGWSAHAEQADVIAWLNCDEQYLEGALSRVAAWMAANDAVSCLFGDVLVVDSDGGLLCYRQAVRPVRRHIATAYLPVFSAAAFLRASAVLKNGLLPDVSWRLLGDVELVFRMLDQRLSVGMLHEPLAAFEDGGDNLSLTEPVAQEQIRMAGRVSPVVRRMTPLWVLEHRLKRLMGGAYRSRRVSYALYADADGARIPHCCERAPTVWRSRL